MLTNGQSGHEGATEMAARATTLRSIRGSRNPIHLRPAPRVVAEILEDGTIRTATGSTAAQDPSWSTATVTGLDWTIWLERRNWQR